MIEFVGLEPHEEPDYRLRAQVPAIAIGSIIATIAIFVIGCIYLAFA